MVVLPEKEGRGHGFKTEMMNLQLFGVKSIAKSDN
jgi:hypothetical protein